MTRTQFVEYHGRGFWAYDVANKIFLKYLIDCALDYCRSSTEDTAWLTEAICWWRPVACISDYCLFIDETWSESQLRIFLRLAEQACSLLEQRDAIPAEEAQSWKILDDLTIFVRGVPEVPTKDVLEVGRAMIALVNGTLPADPPKTWWLFGAGDGQEKTIGRRSPDE